MPPLIYRLLLFVGDAVLINVAVVFAFLMRFDGALPPEFFTGYEKLTIPFTALSLLVFYLSGLYSSLWRYASIDEIVIVVRGTTLSAAILLSLVYIYPYFYGAWHGFPRSVTVLTWLLTTALVGGLRFSYRAARRTWRTWRSYSGSPVSNGAGHSQHRVVVAGAGEAGVLVARELITHSELGYVPVGYVDDDPQKQHMKIQGLPILGYTSELPDVVRRFDVDEVIIAMPSAPGRVVRDIVNRVGDSHIRIKILPGIYELLNGSVSVKQIRDVQIEDLLGREPVSVNLDEVVGYLRGQRVLITGAGGSIGSELCRQVAGFGPGMLILLDNSENGVFETSLDLRYRHPALEQKVIIADVRDAEKVQRLVAQHRPDVVFHAAAHKHVPLMEDNPDEAVKTNIFGTRNMAEAALRSRVKRFVLISTDKAVNPSSVMGATKRVAEMVIQTCDLERRQRESNETRFVAVRFGNVLGSRGSVVPIFKEQIARGGPVTVTHPDMRRYFMTIPEAVQLVIQSGAMGEGGEIFILDMGEPVRIVDLAENLIRLSGFEPGIEIPIVFTGKRPGEKLFEELLSAEEGALATRHQRIYVGRIPAVEPAWLRTHMRALARMVQQHSESQQLVSELGQLVPELRLNEHTEVAASVEPADVLERAR